MVMQLSAIGMAASDRAWVLDRIAAVAKIYSISFTPEGLQGLRNLDLRQWRG